jgi:hypothetical protein
MAPAKTGREKRRRKEVTIMDHTKRGSRSILNPENRIVKIVVIKLIELRIEDTPPRCKEKIAKSTEMSL